MDKEERERSRDRDRSRRDRPTRFSSEGSRDRSPDRGKDRGGMKSSNCRVYVSNIPYEYRWQDLKDLFRSQVGDVAFVELFVDENDKPRGCGIVEFAEPLSVKKALESMHRFELKGRKIVIKEDFGNQRDKYGNLITKRRDRDEHRDVRRDNERSRYDSMGSPGNHQNMGGPPTISGNTYGLSPAFLQELNISTPLHTRIFVANLEYKVDKKKLKEVFRMAGKVQAVDMPLAKDGSSRGFAVVEYDHPVESVQAISMFHGHPLYDRIMTVRMDRGTDRDKLPDGLKTIGPGLGTNGEPLRDVARNLPSLTSTSPQQQQQQGQQQNVNSGPGILGAVPNLQLGLNSAANALSNLTGGVGSALNNLSSTSAAVLQAANLAGVSNLSNNLLTGGLSSSDLSLAANLVQNNPSLAALAAASNAAAANAGNLNNQASGGGGGGGGSGFTRNEHSQQNFLSAQNNYDGPNNSQMGGGNMGASGGGGITRNYQSYESKPAFNFGGNDRDTRPPSNTNIYGTLNNGGQMLRNSSMMEQRKKNKLLIANLPASTSYKLINDKCQEFGRVENVEEHGQGSILVTFQTEWEAERAMKNIDRGRIDGRTIDARLC